MLTEQADVVQSGVQLMNIHSRWFSKINVLEYYFWFKSFLQFFSRVGLIPLGGNTVFFSKASLAAAGGWDEEILTEDADIGIRLSVLGKKVRVVYDEEHVTQEETPLTVSSFIRQRTRWNQGFLQIFLKGDWVRLQTFPQRILAAYVLLWPLLQAMLLVYMVLAFISFVYQKVPVPLAMFSNIPTYLLILILTTMIIGMWEFTKKFSLRFSLTMPFEIIIAFLPYQVLLGMSAARAFLRILLRNKGWEKTLHNNAHRAIPAFKISKALT
jgi:cellulose synthase/poly-beta-1,6-N-acetylglucosamine synthase-like glycosyltransferase